MKTVYKYRFEKTVQLPVDSKVLYFGYQEDVLYLWALVDPKSTRIVPVYYEIYGTGHVIPNYMEDSYVATVFDPLGFVWHIFNYE